MVEISLRTQATSDGGCEGSVKRRSVYQSDRSQKPAREMDRSCSLMLLDIVNAVLRQLYVVHYLSVDF